MLHSTQTFRVDGTDVRVEYHRTADIIDGTPTVRERWYGFTGDATDWTWTVGTREDLGRKLNQNEQTNF
jgi:hypothetical protein